MGLVLHQHLHALHVGTPELQTVLHPLDLCASQDTCVLRRASQDTHVLRRASQDTRALRRASQDTRALRRASQDTHVSRRASQDTRVLRRLGIMAVDGAVLNVHLIL